ncbi:MAG: DPP IV N-terminal domain-containing protein [Planctomycetaceae bacterium]
MTTSFKLHQRYGRTLIQSVLLLLATCCFEQTAEAQRVYRDRVQPKWFGDQSQFWYRNDFPDAKREFVLVDANKATRAPAFDHVAVAGGLAELLKRDVSGEQLPVNEIEFSEDGTQILLIGPDGKFRLQRDSGRVTAESTGPANNVTSLFLPVRPSTDGQEDTEIVVENRLDRALTLIWIDSSGGRREYGTVKSGETRSQHTFAGHVWLFSDADGKDLGCVRAESGGSNLIIDDTVIKNVKVDEPPRRRRRNRQAPESAAYTSPDGSASVFTRASNLWLKITADNSEVQLTTDAVAENTFRRDASRARGMGMEYDLPDFPEDSVDAHWAPNSKAVIAFQTTRVEERITYYIESTPADRLQPKLQSYPYFKPGDALPIARPRLFRVEDRKEIPVSNELFPNPWSLDLIRWSDDGARFWMMYNERGHQRMRILEVTAETGAVRAIVDEHSPTFIHYSSEGKHEQRWLQDNQLLWASERSGWNHLYRYDLSSGQVMNPVTSGEWNLRRIEHIDEDSDTLWFFAVGIRPDQDPYHEHFCRVRLDGTDLTILTEGDGTHEIEWSPDRRWFIDRYSRVDLPPVTELRTADGKLLCALESADASEVLKERGAYPERFVAKGRDGVTDIWGIVHRPRNFDASKSYPVIENIYAGPHDHHVPKGFRPGFGHQHQIADAGFIVVQIDGMGTAWRSKAFHDICYRNLRDAGFPDRILWMKSLKQKVPQIDLTRVGVYGGSAGGQNAMAALLWHGDFYKAAVADCGCHDNRMDKIWWNEQWMGVVEGNYYQDNSNMENAHRLQGSLMLVVGELDRNVDPATTTQVAKKLIDAGKDFEFLLVPGAGHGACETPWASKRRTAFFMRELAQ